MYSTKNENLSNTQKRGPGRPRQKNIDIEKVKKIGIDTVPHFPENIVEFSYALPKNIKGIFNIFKLMQCRDIRFEFTPMNVTITAIGHSEQNFINVVVDGMKLNRYYCKHPVNAIIARKNLDKITQKIDPSYSHIHIIIKEDSYRKNINIILNDENNKVNEYHVINIIEDITENIDHIFSNLHYHNYPLNFRMNSKYFKKVIGDISKYSKEFAIEKREGIILKFPYSTNSDNVVGYNLFTDASKFNIKSTLEPDDFILVSVNIEYITPLSNSLISDNINIYVDKENKMCFKCGIDDDIFELTLCIEIINYR